MVVSTLVVEDDPNTGATLTELLRDAGRRVEWSASAEDARAKLKAFVPRVAVVDLAIPGVDWHDMLRWIVAVVPQVVVLTGATPEVIDEVRRLYPQVRVYQKPVEAAEIVRATAPIK